MTPTGSITKYEWDLDGDGTYERDSGTEPVVTHSYDRPGAVTVTVRVHDDDGKATDETAVVEVAGGAGEAAPPGGGGAVGRTSAAGAVEALGRFRVVGSRAAAGGAVVRVRVPAAGVLRVRAAGAVPVIRPVRVNSARKGVRDRTASAGTAWEPPGTGPASDSASRPWAARHRPRPALCAWPGAELRATLRSSGPHVPAKVDSGAIDLGIVQSWSVV